MIALKRVISNGPIQEGYICLVIFLMLKLLILQNSFICSSKYLVVTTILFVLALIIATIGALMNLSQLRHLMSCMQHSIKSVVLGKENGQSQCVFSLSTLTVLKQLRILESALKIHIRKSSSLQGLYLILFLRSTLNQIDSKRQKGFIMHFLCLMSSQTFLLDII